MEKHLSVNIDATLGEFEGKAQTPNQKTAETIINISLDNLFVPEYPWKAPVLIIGSEVASATPSLAKFGCKEDVSLMNDSDICITSDLYINSYHNRLSNVWSFLYELRSNHIFWIDDVIGPVELDNTTIFNNQYGLIHSPSKSPERLGTPGTFTQPSYMNYELSDNHKSDPLLLTSNAYLKYNDSGTNAVQILPD